LDSTCWVPPALFARYIGTYYYVVRSYFASWTSVNSNEDSVLAL